jgi:alkylated DNA nucleotide flippase Atl1
LEELALFVLAQENKDSHTDSDGESEVSSLYADSEKSLKEVADERQARMKEGTIATEPAWSVKPYTPSPSLGNQRGDGIKDIGKMLSAPIITTSAKSAGPLQPAREMPPEYDVIYVTQTERTMRLPPLRRFPLPPNSIAGGLITVGELRAKIIKSIGIRPPTGFVVKERQIDLQFEGSALEVDSLTCKSVGIASGSVVTFSDLGDIASEASSPPVTQGMKSKMPESSKITPRALSSAGEISMADSRSVVDFIKDKNYNTEERIKFAEAYMEQVMMPRYDNLVKATPSSIGVQEFREIPGLRILDVHVRQIQRALFLMINKDETDSDAKGALWKKAWDMSHEVSMKLRSLGADRRDCFLHV